VNITGQLNRPPTTGTTAVPPPPAPKPLWGGSGNIKTLNCPSATDPSSTVSTLLLAPQTDGARFTYSNRYGNLGPGFLFSAAPGSISLNKSHYMGMAGYPVFNAGFGADNGRGVFGLAVGSLTATSPLNTMQGNTIVSIADGSSNTIFYGEYADCNVNFGTGNVLTGDCAGTFGGGVLYTYWPIRTEPRPTFIWYKYGSKHTGICQFAFGDGSVRGIRNNIDYTTYYLLGGMSDGRVVNLP
jgi:hypothetical protein